MSPLLAQSNAIIVTLLDKPSTQTSFADVLVGAFGLTGVLFGLAAVLGLIFAIVLVMWNRRHRPEDDHLPRVTEPQPSAILRER